MLRHFLKLSLSATVLISSFGCSSTSKSTAGAQPDAGGGPPPPVDPAPATKQILDAVKNYKSWPMFTENSTPKMSDSHMKMYVVTYHNDAVTAAIAQDALPLPPGCTIVKENLANPSDTAPMALTIMDKQGDGSWYWIEATLDGKVIVDPTGKPLEGKDVPMCVGCHSKESSNDDIMTHQFKGAAPEGGSGMLPPVDPAPQTKQVLDSINGYAAWPTFVENSTPKLSDSHMKMFVVTHHNDVVTTAIAQKTLPLPDGAIIVKDNMVNATDKMPMAITVMSKLNGSWYWVEATPDNKVMVDPSGKPLEGTNVTMCIGCHSMQSANDDVMTHDFKM
jgi:hypothetical protein